MARLRGTMQRRRDERPKAARNRSSKDAPIQRFCSATRRLYHQIGRFVCASSGIEFRVAC
jgi:hypothetical protein